MTKNQRFIFAILMIMILLLCSCDMDKAAYHFIDVTQTTKTMIASDPSYQKEYNGIPSELEAVIRTVDTLIGEQGSPVQQDVVFSEWDDLLHLSLEQEDGSLIMITLYSITEDEGFVRCIEHTVDDVQTELVSFPFQDKQFLDAVQSIRSTLEE